MQTDIELQELAKKIVSRKKKAEIDKLVAKLEKKYFDKLKADIKKIQKMSDSEKVDYKNALKKDKEYFQIFSKSEFGKKYLNDVLSIIIGMRDDLIKRLKAIENEKS